MTKERTPYEVVADPASDVDAVIAVFLSPGGDGHLREAAITHPAVTTQDVQRLLDQTEDHERVLALTHASDVLEVWAWSSLETVRAIVAFNPHTPPETVESLSRDSSAAVRANALLNPRLSLSTRMQLLRNDIDEDIRELAIWATRTVTGRAVASGERWLQYADDDPEPNEVRLLYYPLR